MIYVRPRKKMSVERMRRQQQKHLDLRYRTVHVPRDLLEFDALEWMVNETAEYFRMEVARWNMWQNYELSPVSIFTDYNLDLNTVRYTFEVCRLRKPKKKPRSLKQIVDDFCDTHIDAMVGTPNEICMRLGYGDPL